MTRTLFIFLITSMLGAACTTKEVDCKNPQMLTSFIGYTIPELDTLVIRKFKNDGTFTQKLDSFLFFNNTNFNNLAQFGDTIFMQSFNEKFNITADHDWQISIPALNKTINIGPFTIEQKKGKCQSGLFSMTKVSCDCPNNVKILKLDNQTLTFPDGKYTHSIYFRK